MGLGLLSNVSASAATLSYNPPKALRYAWRTKTSRIPNGGFYNYYVFKELSVSRGGRKAFFDLDGFVLRKNKQSNNDSGAYGVFASSHWKLEYQKVSSHRYYVAGAMQPITDGSNTPAEAGVVFSKSFKSIKVYTFDVKLHHGHWYRAKKHYEGHFYRGEYSYYSF